jgi:hypothetical protein
MTIEINVAKVLAHSVMLFAKDNWHKDYPSIPWGEPQMCAPSYNAPDLAAANEAAVKAQAETFPKLRALDAAARLGRKITFEGKTYDFSGGEDGLPIGDLQIAETFARAAAAIAPELTGKQLELAKQYGTQFAQQRREELEALDPTKFGLYENYLRDVGASVKTPEARIDSPTYEQVGIPRSSEDTGAARLIRSELERQVQQGLSQVGTLDPSMERRVQQAARARGTAIGNVLGNPSAIRESLALQDALGNANAQRWNAALGLLQSGQTTSDTANRQAQEAFQNILAATGQRNTAAQQSFASQLTSQQQGMANRQQNIANVQSALGLAPIVGQAANLGALQQGASPFATPQYTQGMQMSSPGDLMKMGTGFALTNADNQYKSDLAGSFMNQFQGYASGIGNLATGYGNIMRAGMGCYVARECIPDQWEAFFFWKELVGPAWFKSFYNNNSEKIANWIKNKPKVKKLVAKWMLGRINSIIPKN